jgi:CRP/FNR family transcriptional regulator, cyclic AMP receptor protein
MRRFASTWYARGAMDPAALRACALFQSLSADQLRKVASIARARDLASGEAIFREGDPGDGMFVVISGRVRISKRVEGVGEEALSILGPGSYFGEMAMIDDAARSADAQAHTACALAVIRREDLDQLMFIDKDLAYDLLWTLVRTLSARLRETNEKIKTFFAISGKFQ